MPLGRVLNEPLHSLPCTGHQDGVPEEELQEQTVHVAVGTESLDTVSSLLAGNETLDGGREGRTAMRREGRP